MVGEHKQKQPAIHNLSSLWLFWLTGAAQGLLAIAFLLRKSLSSSTGGAAGISSTRLLAITLILLPTFLFLVLAFLHTTNQPKYKNWLKRLNQYLVNERFLLSLLLAFGGVFLASTYLITVTPDMEEPFTRSLLENFTPLLMWVSGLAAQSLLFLSSSRIKACRNIEKPKIFLISVVIFGLTFIAWAWIAQVTLPSESQIRGWNSLGVPVMETQLWIAWLISLGFLGLLVGIEHQIETRKFLSRLSPSRIDIIVCVLLWALAVISWQSVAAPTSWFVTESRPPNFEPYPNSDAYYYDISAQSALIGEGFVFFDAQFIRRPLHAAFLTLLHLIGGPDFNQVISLQLLVLAFLPVLVYLVGRTLHNRISGMLAALLILMREASSIAISGNITASHVKLLMVDVPVALMATLFVLAMLRWLQNLQTGKLHAMIAGAALGASILIRNETVIFAIPLALITFWKSPKEKRVRFWMQQIMLFTWGICLVIAPWVWRNYNLTGKVFIDSPIMRFDLIAQRYQDANQASPPAQPEPAPALPEATPTQPQTTPTESSQQAAGGEPAQISPTITPEPSGEFNAELYVQTVAQQTLEFVTRNPANVAGFIFSHYTNSQLQTLLIFPNTFRPLDSLLSLTGHRSMELFWDECCSMQNYTRRLPFWRKWDGVIPSQSILPIILNILVLSWGFQIAWRQNKLTGLAPLALTFTYLAMNALFRNSGGRYILPVDWIMIIYFSIGLADLSIRVMHKIIGFKMPVNYINSMQDYPIPHNKPAILRSPAFYALSVGILLFASLIPLTEKAFPQRYTPQLQNELHAALLESTLLEPEQRSLLDSFLNNGGSLVSGRALYPRFFRESLGEPGSNNPFGPQPYPRIGFYLAGPQYSPVILPTLTKPRFLPHASDVLVYRCSAEEVFAVAVFDEEQAVQAFYMRSPSPISPSCPFPPQDISIQVK